MKKLSLITVFILMMSMMVPVFATSITEEGDKEVLVKYTTEGKYTITIPTEVDFNVDSTLNPTVSASDVLLEFGETLKVSVSSLNYANETWNLVDETSNNNKLAYKITCNDNEIANNDTVLEIEAGNTNGGSSELGFEITGEKNVAGSYLDTLTFTVSVD